MSSKILQKDKNTKMKLAEKPKIAVLPPEKMTPAPELAQTLLDPNTGATYKRGSFLGKGGFAKCYEMTDMKTDIMYAGKIVPKSLLTKSHQRDKMAQEIQIHKALKYKHIVGFHSFFDDAHYVYIILELCRKRSMMELYKRRKAVTEPEVRFYMKQIIDAVCYLHSQHIIHRDLKLGNLFLNDDFQVKIGDFGLATHVEYDGERKKTLCGTPNYIAPEVLCKKGHSYEVDVWSVGCILYTLLVGKPPFETMSLKETYHRIKKNEYYIPSKVPHSAQLLIIKMLRPDPTKRPSMKECQDDPFFNEGFTPLTLPNSSLTMAPRFSTAQYQSVVNRKPLTEANRDLERVGSAVLQNIPESSKAIEKNNVSRAVFVKDGLGHDVDDDPCQEEDCDALDHYLGSLLKLLDKVLDSRPADRENVDMDDAEDPALTPVCWVSKWVDYSDKYGLGYQLSDGSVGVLFNDSTRLLMHEDQQNLQYICKQQKETYFKRCDAPSHMHKKKTLLEYFNDYMHEHLLKTGSGVAPKGIDNARLPYLRSWFRTRSGIILHLNIGILQINFFQDHTKVIICPKMEAVSYIDESRIFRTFKLQTIIERGCTRELFVRLRYAKTMVERLIKKLQEDEQQQV